MPDWAAVAFSDRNGNHGLRDHAAGEGDYRVLHEEPAFSEVFVSMSGYDFRKGQGIMPAL